MQRALFVFALTLSVSHAAFAANPYYYSKQVTLMGADQVMASANYGKDVKFGVIDTGIIPWVGVSSAVALGTKTDLMLDASVARSNGASLSGGLVENVTPLYAYSLGASVAQHDAFKRGDGLSLSLRAPLRVYSGSASVATTSVNEFGEASTTTQQVSLRPNGRELSLSANYGAPVSQDISWGLTATARKDAENVAGQDDASLLLNTKMRF